MRPLPTNRSASLPPFECSWEAGPSVLAHQVRVVADLVAGGRVIKTVRTRALGYGSEGEARLNLFKKCPLGCFHLTDIEGTHIDVME